jgi:transcriptional regulator with XRE-family HTH domain
MNNVAHWTERSTQDFLYSIASDFIEDLKEKMIALGMNQQKLANAAKVNKSYVSRTFKDPGNLTLETIVKFARSVGMKVSLVAYEDGDTTNERGPVDSSVFRLCWEKAKQPADRQALQVEQVKRTTYVLDECVLGQLPFGLNQGIYNRTADHPPRFNATGIGVTVPVYSKHSGSIPAQTAMTNSARPLGVTK